MVYFIDKYQKNDVKAVLYLNTNKIKYYVYPSKIDDLHTVYLNTMLENDEIEIVNSETGFTEEEQKAFDSMTLND